MINYLDFVLNNNVCFWFGNWVILLFIVIVETGGGRGVVLVIAWF